MKREGVGKRGAGRKGKVRVEDGVLPVDATATVTAAEVAAVVVGGDALAPVSALSIEDGALAGLAVMESGGLSPLAYLLRVMRDENESPARRMDAAKTAAPFVHPKLATMDVKSAGLDRMGDALAELIERAQADGGGAGGLLGR